MMAIQAQLYSDNNFRFPLGGSQNWMDNAYGFNDLCFNLPQKLENHCFENSGLVSDNNNPQSVMGFSQSLFAQLEKQRLEVDRFINLQNERLRLALQEQRKQQIALLLRKYELKAVNLLKQKDEEITKAMNRAMELEEFLRRIEIENQAWQRLAKENEAMIVSLTDTIEKIKENAFLTNGVEDAESCCDLETGENRGHEIEIEEEQGNREMVCKSCNSLNSCVIFLPCRHLCCCRDCHVFLDSCPACGMVKKATIEALF